MNLRYNPTSGQTRFRFFKSGQSAISLFKLGEVENRDYYLCNGDDGQSSLSMQFACFIPEDIYDTLSDGSSFGMMYALKSNLGSKTLEDAIDEINSNGLDDTKTAYANKLHVEEKTPVLESGNYHWGVTINHIPESQVGVSGTICAAGYLLNNGTYYIISSAEYCVNSLAAAYVAPGMDTSSYSAFVPVLNWLSTYSAR